MAGAENQAGLGADAGFRGVMKTLRILKLIRLHKVFKLFRCAMPDSWSLVAVFPNLVESVSGGAMPGEGMALGRNR